jgi:hypothetical protein
VVKGRLRLYDDIEAYCKLSYTETRVNMARPRKETIMQAVSLRLPAGLLARVDACADQLQKETPLLEVTRTDALRYLIQTGLAEFDKPRRRPTKSGR